ncbi:hypothetical protein BJ742DRAFT_805555 [Cladochytrium replicatum]|nr:hypothetical protein BJ742DRAFT_805555 [Cladochytrium replicatum]
MGFTALDTDAGLAVLNAFLEDKSYIEGFTPSQADVAVFDAVKKAPNATTYPHAARWFKHIASFGAAKSSLPGAKKAASAYGPEASAPAADAADDDDIDLFGSEDEEVDEEAEKLKQKRLEEYHAKKANKPKVVAKSMISLDVKPWDDETDLKEMEKSVRSITMDGLVWGASQLIPVGYGISKLRIGCVVEDDKVGVDDLSDQITAFEDYVQSVDVHTFNKL